MNNDLIGLIIGFLLTIFIYSYIWGDNPLYRLAVHILVGVSAAYAAVVVVDKLLLPFYRDLQDTPSDLALITGLVPLLLGLLLVLKRLPRLAWMGTGTMALLIGVGAAVSLMGALTGTLLPQITAVAHPNPLVNLVITLLTAVTLLTFTFSAKAKNNSEWKRPWWQQIGQGILMITFGALFASVLNTSFILLIERISYFAAQVTQLLS
ncbi:MAG: hypothetical protein H6662_11740 [Ardenticatenaceae bacterium]|nr:hypothetical protein [Anaerolineales bacterium]MCB8922247.1 hypothetical protein [Ardenticatenaceae bacterium]MCB8990568.1 hypothetical protein [Ardenticatenaceae bacterium]